MRRTILVGASIAVLRLCSPGLAQTEPVIAQNSIQQAQHLDHLPPVHPEAALPKKVDRSGRAQQGKASYYASHFDHHRMADGRPLNPNANVAASKTLPIGTTAKVVNLDNGKSATVKVEDRGPFVKGRVVDVTPKVANELGMKHKGVVPVVVKPITVPMPDGGVKLGAGAATATPGQIQAAATETEQVVDHKPSATIGKARTETASR